METIPNTEEPKKSKKRVIIAIIIFIVVVILLLIQPAHKALKKWRSHHFYEQAQKSLATNDLNAALTQAFLSLQVNPDNVQALRIMVNILSVSLQPEAMGYWEKLLQSPHVNDEDKINFLEYCINIGYVTPAKQYLTELLSQPVITPQTYFLAIRFCQADNNFPLGMLIALQAQKQYPEDTKIQSILAQFLIAKADTASLQQAHTLLSNLSKSSDITARINAYILLSQHFSLDNQEKENILNDPEFALIQKNNPLIASTLQILLQPNQKNTIIQTAIDHFKRNNNITLPQLASWLNQNEAYTQTLSLIDPKTAITSHALIIPYLDALASLGRWNDVYDTIYQDNLPIDPILTQLFRMRTNWELGNKNIAQTEWKITLTLAKKDLPKLRFIADYCQKLKLFDFAIEAHTILLEDPMYAMPAGKQLMVIGQIQGNTLLILDTLKKLTRLFPDDISIQSGILYTQLLLNPDIDTTLTNAHLLLENNPDHLYIHHIIALAYLLEKKPQDALQEYEKIPLDLNTLLPSWKVIYACTLQANQKTQEALTISKNIPLNALKPEEKKLLATYQLIP